MATRPRRPTRPGCRSSPATTPSTPGHACFTGAVTTSLQRYFGTKHVQLTLTTPAGVSRTYERLDDLVAEVEDARVWGGLHYRTTMTETAKHFPRIADDIAKDHFFGRGR
jgi:hypothetical protein